MIKYDSSTKCFKLDTCDTSYVVGVYEQGYLLNLYYGALLPDDDFRGLDHRLPCASFSPADPVIGEHGFSVDCAPMEYSTNGRGDFRVSALSVKNQDGNSVTDLRYFSHNIIKSKPSIEPLPSLYDNGSEVETLEIITRDVYTGLEVSLFYCVFEKKGVITRYAVIKNKSDSTLKINRAMSGCIDFPTMDFDLITLYGRHNKERMREQRALAHGLQGIASKRGSSSHAQNPFAALLRHGADEDRGDAYGFNLVYSGNFECCVECDFSGTSRLVMGINSNDFEWTLEPGESFTTPELVMVYSSEGLGEMSRKFHRIYSDNLISGIYKYAKRPLLINSWEAAYFDFDTEKLLSFAERARELGIEMLVMDDGWFGRRNDDTCSLGDWFVNENKLKGGLKPLVEGVNKLGLKFGIWFEPEMISPDSELFRAHPDWCVHVKGREPSIARHQYVLDVSRQDVRDYIFSQMSSVFEGNNIEYLKWDFNRNISEAGSALLSAERSGEFFHRFVLGTYELMRRFTEKFPNVLFENCSGGGGRFDPGMLSFSPQIWTSDNTDPIERLDIQFGTSLCYPAACQGAHVSANRRTGYETKGNVALWGTFGYELDPNKLTVEDRETVKAQVEEYHRFYELIHKGELYRLIDPYFDKYRCAWSFVSVDKNEALLTCVAMRRPNPAPFYLKLKGLSAEQRYSNSLDGQVHSGAFYMRCGIDLTNYVDYDGKSVKVYLKAVN